MPTLRERAVNLIGGKSLRQQNAQLLSAMNTMFEAYLDGPFQQPPEQLIGQLKEYDAGLLYDLVNELQYDKLGSLAGFDNLGRRRERAVLESERLWHVNPLAEWTIRVWTNFGLGESVNVSVPDDEEANEVLQEAWTAPRNANLFSDDRIQDLSNWTLVKGNQFLVAFISTVDGKVDFNKVDAAEIEIITHPEDKTKPLFYKREWTGKDNKPHELYYPDYVAFFDKDKDLEMEDLLPSDAKRSDEGEKSDSNKTVAVILHIAHNLKEEDSLWGWPIMGASVPPYMRSHKKFMEDRLTVAAGKAMYVRRKQITGGSRGVNAIRNTLRSSLSQSNFTDTNPPGTSGSTELDNKMVDTTDLPMTTGAFDAKADHNMFAWMALIGAGMFPTTAGLDTSRFATAIAMDKTQAMQWSRYKTFWAAQFKKIGQIVLLAATQYGSKNFLGLSVQVSTDVFSTVDLPAIVDSLSSWIDSALIPFTDNGIIDGETTSEILKRMWLIVLQAIGVDEPSSLVDSILNPGGEPTSEPKTEPEEISLVKNVVSMIKSNYEKGDVSAKEVVDYLLESV